MGMKSHSPYPASLRFVDLFCGIGGFHVAARSVSAKTGLDLRCVFASDIDPECQRTYEANFGLRPVGDIREVAASAVPEHDLLFAGFPCQPFSIIGNRGGFEDVRGTLFFDIVRILNERRPTAFVLENVKTLIGHDKGRTLARILDALGQLGYYAHYRVLNALDYGLPQKRERVIFVGFREPLLFLWPQGGSEQVSLEALLEEEVPSRYYVSERVMSKRSQHGPGLDGQKLIWHENKSGHISKLSYSCALRAGASYNYLLVNGVRRLTEREMLRLQGFPDDFVYTGSYSTVKRQAGNAVPVPMIAAVLERVVDTLFQDVPSETSASYADTEEVANA